MNYARKYLTTKNYEKYYSNTRRIFRRICFQVYVEIGGSEQERGRRELGGFEQESGRRELGGREGTH